jgi:glucose/arabinose dehydrogenase
LPSSRSAIGFDLTNASCSRGCRIEPASTFATAPARARATTPAIHSRFTANGNVAVVDSGVELLNLNNLGATNHNGGGIHFALDGKRIAGVGENANDANAQTLYNLLGKMLRINADGSIPTDNPLYR